MPCWVAVEEIEAKVLAHETTVDSRVSLPRSSKQLKEGPSF